MRPFARAPRPCLADACRAACVWSRVAQGAKEYFLWTQQRRILRLQHQHEDALVSVEACKSEKRVRARALHEELPLGEAALPASRHMGLEDDVPANSFRAAVPAIQTLWPNPFAEVGGDDDDDGGVEAASVAS